MKRIVISFLLSAAAAIPAELPVTEVVLYKHGVGFFQRSGKLAPGESARLDFDASEMNDVLKSLTVLEGGGGRILGLRYDSEDPISRRMAGFPFQIGGSQSLSAVLDQLKGARLEVKIGSETLSGTIVTARALEGGERQPEREQIVLLMDTGELRTLDLSSANSMRLTDARLQEQFKEYLGILASSRSKEKRSVYIDSTDAKARDVLAGYMIPAAVWKSSYRLMLSEPVRPTLEGWAIVDNTTGDDWTRVRLSLVSGRPISFVSQLYPARYKDRPAAELADDGAARPVVHAGSYEEPLRMRVGGNVGGVGGNLANNKVEVMAEAAPVARPGAAMFDAGALPRPQVAPSTVMASAAAGALGELFEYRLAQPVTIRRGESAMLPFLQQEIEGRKLLIYSGGGSEHPTNAAEITNSSGKTLDGGPITVYDSGAYGGEALMETLKAGDKRLISYAVDLGTRITQAFGGKAAMVRGISANRGVLTTKLASEETRTYTIRNVDQKAKTLILEHPLRSQYELLNQKPAEKTSSAYRFEIKLPAASTEEFAVAEERVYDQTYAVTNLSPEILLNYVSNRNLSDAGRRQLQAIADQKRRIAETDRALAGVADQIRDVSTDEERIRQNIRSLNGVSGQQQQVQTYARQIDEMEQRMAGLRDRQAELQKQKTALEGELAKSIETLSF